MRREVPAVEDTVSPAGREQQDEAASEGDGGAGGAGEGGAGGGRGAGRNADRRRRRRRALRWSATVLALVILGGAGAGYLYYEHLNANIKSDDLNIGDAKDRAAKTEANSAGQTALNILLIGSDARDTAENQKLGGAKDTFDGPRSRTSRCCCTYRRTAATCRW